MWVSHLYSCSSPEYVAQIIVGAMNSQPTYLCFCVACTMRKQTSVIQQTSAFAVRQNPSDYFGCRSCNVPGTLQRLVVASGKNCRFYIPNRFQAMTARKESSSFQTKKLAWLHHQRSTRPESGQQWRILSSMLVVISTKKPWWRILSGK